MEVFLSSHAHTTYRPREPATTAQDMHWHKPDHPGLGPRAPQGTQHLCFLPATPQRKPVLTPEPTAQPAWLGLAPRMAEGKGDSQVGGWHRPEGAKDLSDVVTRASVLMATYALCFPHGCPPEPQIRGPQKDIERPQTKWLSPRMPLRSLCFSLHFPKPLPPPLAPFLPLSLSLGQFFLLS